jgi:hypothetical protein
MPSENTIWLFAMLPDGEFLMPGCSGRINWVHVRAIHRAIAMHLVDLNEDEPFVLPLILIGMSYCQSVIPLGWTLLGNVTGPGSKGCGLSRIPSPQDGV